MPQCYLLKTEPDVFSIDDLKRDGSTGWTGVRNHQAKAFLKGMKIGDIALIYHSVEERQIVGIGKITREAFPDPDPERKGDWVQVEVSYVRHVKKPLTLAEMKAEKLLKDLLFIRQSRLSVSPVGDKEWKWIQSKIM
jgi:predicted RNA-binding protein with PUA-like domain